LETKLTWINSITSYLSLPVIQKILISLGFLIVIGLAIIFIRRLISSFKIDAEKNHQYKRWTIQTGLIIYILILIRIWVYIYLLKLIPTWVIHKFLISAINLAFIFAAVYFIRYLINNLKIKVNKKKQYKKWISHTFTVIYLLILIRIWAITDLFVKPVFKKLFLSLLFLGIIYIALFFVRRFINSLNIEIVKRHQYRKRATYVATLIYAIILILIWAGNTQQWATVLSVLGAGIALALHEVLLNMAGWVYIVIRHPYRANDRIEIGKIRGDVIDIRLFQTTLLEIGNWIDGDQSTGRLVHLPHGQIFRNPLYNYTQGFEYLWNEISIVISFESNWESAKEILLKCGEEESREIQEKVAKKIDQMSQEYLIYYRKFTPIVYTKIGDSGVKLTLRYLTDAKKRRIGEDTISQKILKEIRKISDVEFAYPTYRIYKRSQEEG
jgi:small-conductance mechanosensitive channel